MINNASFQSTSTLAFLNTRLWGIMYRYILGVYSLKVPSGKQTISLLVVVC